MASDSDAIAGFNINANRTGNESGTLNSGQYFFSSDSSLNTRINILGDARWYTLTNNIFLEREFKSGSRLKFDADYIFYNNDNPTSIRSVFWDEEENVINPDGGIYADGHLGESKTSINVGVFKTDYETRLNSKIRLETGLKGTFSNTKNAGSIHRKSGSEWILDERSLANLEVKEYLGAAYSILNYEIDSLTNMNLGFRFEYWNRDFNDDQLDRDFGKLFPSFFLSRRLTDRSALNLAYNRRISRPDYNDLASFLVYNGPVSVFSGNPLLKPSISDNLKISYQHNGKSFSIEYLYVRNPIARYQLTETANSDLLIVSPQNVAYQKEWAFRTNIPWQLKDWWTFNMGGSLGWRQFRLEHTKEKVKKNYLAYNIYGSQQIKLPQDFLLEISGWYNSEHYNGSVRVEGFGVIDAGVKKTFAGNHGSLQLSVNDIFQSMTIDSYIGELTEEAISAESRVHFEAESARARIFRLTYFRSFGGKKIKSRMQRNGAASDERSRIRNN